MVGAIAGCDETGALAALAKAGGDVKLAALLASGLATDAAKALIDRHDGDLRKVMAEIAAAQ
jgi:N-acetylmuramic acid 6-phosphate etherase